MTVGERLREARERQKVSLHAIAEKTNISVRFLDAIEKNQFDKLPGGIFTRGFIRSYAAQVGLEPDGLVTQFLSDEPGQRDDDIDEAPAKLAGDGPSLGTLVLAGLGVIRLALALVFLRKPDWLGLQAAAAPQATTPVAGRACREPDGGGRAAGGDGHGVTGRDGDIVAVFGRDNRCRAGHPQVAAAAGRRPVGTLLGAGLGRWSDAPRA